MRTMMHPTVFQPLKRKLTKLKLYESMQELILVSSDKSSHVQVEYHSASVLMQEWMYQACVVSSVAAGRPSVI